jgi:gliding motility-associated-like protein
MTLNADGTITVAPGTPAGTYTITYSICEVLNPTNCDTVTTTVIVGGCLDFAINDCDGDGVTNGQEVIDGTDPTNPCESKSENVTLPLSQEFLNGDCDGDGLLNGEEIGQNPIIPFDSNGNGIPDYLEVNNYTVSEDDLEIFSAVSPNGDGDNDVFVIRNIESYPDNTVSIYNRWGVAVYEVDGYGKDNKFFKGISEGRITIKQQDELPVGTYFYIIRYKNSASEQKQRSGYLYINR